MLAPLRSWLLLSRIAPLAVVAGLMFAPILLCRAQEATEFGASDAAVDSGSDFSKPRKTAQALQISEAAWGPEVNGLRAALVKSDVVACDEQSMLLSAAVVVKNVTRHDHIRFEECHAPDKDFDPPPMNCTL